MHMHVINRRKGELIVTGTKQIKKNRELIREAKMDKVKSRVSRIKDISKEIFRL